MVEIRPLDTTAFGGHSGTARFKGNLCTIFYNRNLKNLPLSERSPSDLPQANSTEGSKATTTIVAGCGNKPQSYLALGTTGNPVTRNPQKPAPLHLQCCGSVPLHQIAIGLQCCGLALSNSQKILTLYLKR